MAKLTIASSTATVQLTASMRSTHENCFRVKVSSTPTIAGKTYCWLPLKSVLPWKPMRLYAAAELSDSSPELVLCAALLSLKTTSDLFS
jgi:hypothetical protein